MQKTWPDPKSESTRVLALVSHSGFLLTQTVRSKAMGQVVALSSWHWSGLHQVTVGTCGVNLNMDMLFVSARSLSQKSVKNADSYS